MNKSEQINELAAAMAKAQAEIENASKNSKNPHFRSNYADLAEVLNTVRPVFSKHGLSVTQFPSFESGIVSVETVVMHSSGQWISGTISAPVSKQDAQGVGSATTYCRRYSLAAVAGVAQEDDDANSSVGHAPAKAQAAPVDPRIQAMNEAAKQYGKSVQAIKEGIASGDLSTAAEAWFELSDEAKEALWVAPTKGGIFTIAERDTIKSREFREAHYGPTPNAA